MKTRIFLTLFFILFFFAEVVSSEKEGVLYYRLENGSWSYFENGDDEKDAKYWGEIKNGQPHGQGTLNLSHGKYVGEFKNGLTNGFGIFDYSDGSKYIGNWKDDKTNGQGIFLMASGTKFVGKFKDNLHEEGIISFANGNQFIGILMRGKPFIGTLKQYELGIIFVGLLNKNVLPWSGEGHSASEPNILLKYVNGKESIVVKKEETLFRWNTVSGFVWKAFGNKQKHGFYFGQVAEGVPNGQGFLTLSSGSTYEGGFKDGELHGSGEMIATEGGISIKSVGQYKFGKANGQNIVIFPDRSILMGEVKEDQPWEAIYFDRNMNILNKWENGIKKPLLNNFR